MFENHTLLSLRLVESTQGKHIVVLMDNATMHQHSKVLKTAKRMHASVLFNAHYSPWINPIADTLAASTSKSSAAITL